MVGRSVMRRFKTYVLRTAAVGKPQRLQSWAKRVFDISSRSPRLELLRVASFR